MYFNNRVLKFQDGGSMEQGTGMEEQIMQLVQAAMSGDEQAAQQIQQIMQAAQQGDGQAGQIAQMIQSVMESMQGQQPEAMKCGGRVKKVKKACGGKKFQNGGKPIERGFETSKSYVKVGSKGCKCQLKRVGGRIVNVDCNGNIVKRSQGGELIPYALQGEKVNFTTDRYGNVIKHKNDTPGSAYAEYRGTGVGFGDNKRNVLYERAADGKYYKLQKNWWNTLLSGIGLSRDKYTRRMEVTGDKELQRAKDAFTKSSVGSPNNINYLDSEGTMHQKAPIDASVFNTHPAQPTTTVNSNFGPGKSGKWGGYTYDEARAMQEEMKAAGFDPGELDGKFGPKSKKAWEAYQASKNGAANTTTTTTPVEETIPLTEEEAPIMMSVTRPSSQLNRRDRRAYVRDNNLVGRDRRQFMQGNGFYTTEEQGYAE